MTVLRKHQRQTFTVIDNDALTDSRLSWKATGLLVFLLSRPDDWKVNSTDLTTRKLDGRRAVLSGMAELEEFGYLKRTKHQLPDGTWSTVVHVAESPELLTEIPDQLPLPGVENRDPVPPGETSPGARKPTAGEPTFGKRAPLPKTDYQVLELPNGSSRLEELKQVLVEVFGEPPPQNWSLYNRVATWIRDRDGSPDELRFKASRIAEEWGIKALTPTSLEKHWTRYDAEVGQLTDSDVEKYQGEIRRAQRQRRAEQLEAGS